MDKHDNVSCKDLKQSKSILLTLAHWLSGRVFANSPGDRGLISGWVIQKTQKIVPGTSLLNTQHLKVRFKGKVEQFNERQ